jgi:hypothetical protein
MIKEIGMRRSSAAKWQLTGLIAMFLMAGPMAYAAEIPSAADACAGGHTETTPSSEFTADGDGSLVKHQRTTLEWQRCTVGQTWDGKARLCAGRPASYPWEKTGKVLAKQKDGWRLPSGEELLSIVEKCHVSPSINTQVFPNTPGSLYWTVSSDTGGLERAWSVSFFSGTAYRPGKTQSGRIRLVRGTMNKDAAP